MSGINKFKAEKDFEAVKEIICQVERGRKMSDDDLSDLAIVSLSTASATLSLVLLKKLEEEKEKKKKNVKR